MAKMIGRATYKGNAKGDYANICFNTADRREMPLGMDGGQYCKVFATYNEKERRIEPSEELDSRLIGEGLKIEGLTSLTVVLRENPPLPVDEEYKPTVGIEVSTLRLSSNGDVINVGNVYELELVDGMFTGMVGRYSAHVDANGGRLEITW